MATTNINVRVDSALKQEAEALFNDLGLSMSTAINMFLRSAINHDGIPFEVRRSVPNAETRAALDEDEEMKKNPDNYKRYESFDEVINDLKLAQKRGCKMEHFYRIDQDALELFLFRTGTHSDLF